MTYAKLVVLVVCLVVVGTAAAPPCLSGLDAYVKNLISGLNANTVFGIHVLNPLTNTTLYSHNPSTFFAPASNTKLLSTSSLFTVTSPDYTYKTPVYAKNHQSPNGPDFCFQGKGDPSLSYDQLQAFSKNLIQQKIGKVNSIAADASYFDEPVFPTSWSYDDLAWYYGAPPSALLVNENYYTFTIYPTTVGSPVKLEFLTTHEGNSVIVNNYATTGPANSINTISIIYPIGSLELSITGNFPVGSSPIASSTATLEPSNFFLNMMNQSFSANGVSLKDINRSPAVSCDSSEWSPFYTFTSQPLHDLMFHCLQISDNLYAELFLKLVGKLVKGPGLTTYDIGVNSVHQTLVSQFKTNPNDVNQVDGSGLSRDNLINPDAFVSVLNGLKHRADFETYKSYLPVAGKSGTLEYRFIGTPAQGKVWAKTGSLTGVNSLSGYAQNDLFKTELVFSILENASNQPASVNRKIIDEIVIYLVEMANC